jgi:SMP-30/Gluconolactonase/LRE-like region
MEGIVFGESPRWHDGKVWFSDWGAHQVIALDLAGSHEVVATVQSFPMCIDILPDGRLLVVDSAQRRLLRREPDESLVQHADLGEISQKPWNDIVADGQGNAYVHLGGDPRRPPRRNLHRRRGRRLVRRRRQPALCQGARGRRGAGYRHLGPRRLRLRAQPRRPAAAVRRRPDLERRVPAAAPQRADRGVPRARTGRRQTLTGRSRPPSRTVPGCSLAATHHGSAGRQTPRPRGRGYQEQKR